MMCCNGECPPTTMNYVCLQEMSKILQHPQVYSFLHIPVQSGSNSVLEEMKREYTREDFECLVDFLKERYKRSLESTITYDRPGGGGGGGGACLA